MFSWNEVHEMVTKLPDKLTAGLDGIPALIVKKCADTLTFPILLLINLALKTGKFPTEWKKAKIVPVFKSGKQSSIVNYRPISIFYFIQFF